MMELDSEAEEIGTVTKEVTKELEGIFPKLRSNCNMQADQLGASTSNKTKVLENLDVGACIQYVQSANLKLKRKLDHQYHVNQQYNRKLAKLNATSMLFHQRVFNLQDTLGQIGSELFTSQVDGAPGDTSEEDSDSFTFAYESEDSYTFANSDADSEESGEKCTFIQNPIQTVLFKKALVQEDQLKPHLETSVTCSVGCNKGCGSDVLSWSTSDLENIRKLF